VDCFYESLCPAVIAKRFARRLNATGKSRIADDATVPDLFEDFVSRYEPLAVLDKESEQGEYLRLERMGQAAGPKLDLGQIELEAVEPVNHGCEDKAARRKPPRDLHAFSKLRRAGRRKNTPTGRGHSAT
jgi:hypothetical protein